MATNQTRLTHRSAAAVLAGLAGSAAALAIAPVQLPDGYSWLSMTTSESAAQRIDGAWLARLGFVAFGLSVAVLARHRVQMWGLWSARFHTSFGVFMVAAAAFSTRAWDPAVGFDPTEDVLHSVTATAMGFAFAAGIVAALVQARRQMSSRPMVFDVVAVAASVVIPLGMTAWPGVDGALQRLMFAVAYAWYAVEAVRGRSAAGWTKVPSGRSFAPGRYPSNEQCWNQRSIDP